ncbi:MAG: RsmB/NOP family class I SAM-dependent RNA methyltransferase [Candidatus Magasanikbacteria bacterium]|nr:RsmB/NOP family class I SAM-dependent RNA methyltransferase [Candidatus Magasanikbacteria bacterium]
MKKKKKPQMGLPEKFVSRLQECCGVSVAREMEKSFVERLTTFRLNNIKAQEHENIKANLSAQGFRLKKVSWYLDAFILENKSKRDLTDTQEYKDGKIYIQSLASMVPPIILDPKPGEKILDLTAAPGSKTSQIAMMMERTGELVANDVNKVRFFKLMHNMELLGVSGSEGEPHPHVKWPADHHVAGASLLEIEGGNDDESSKWNFRLRMEHGSKLCKEFSEYFDKILLDAPCSAEARFIIGQPKTLGFWSEKKIKDMAYTQRQLMLSAWGALKPGGVMVYSTCTMAPEENEMQVSRLLERNPDAELMDIELSSLKHLPPVKAWKGKVFDPTIKKTLRIMPTKEIEGFFVAKIRKRV